MPVYVAATGNPEGDEGEDQEFAHGEPKAGDCADVTLTVPAAVAREPHADAIRSTCGDGIPAFRRALGEPDSRFGWAPLHAWQAHQETTGHKPPVNGDAMASQELRRAGLTVTHPRMRILSLLAQRSAHHPRPAAQNTPPPPNSRDHDRGVRR